MDGWMNGYIDAWMDGCMDGCIDAWMDECMDALMVWYIWVDG